MNRHETTWRRRGIHALAALASACALVPGLAHAQGGAAPAAIAPNSVLLFPVAVNLPDAPAADAAGKTPALSPVAKQTQDIVTDAIRKQLARSGISVTVYSRRLPSIQRAVTEASLRTEDANAGPGDDPRKARKLADIVGATEFITATVDDLKFDVASRTASFNLSVFRNATADGAALGTAAAPGKAVAPADVAGSLQQGSAVAHAADDAAAQAVQGLYPRAAPENHADSIKAAASPAHKDRLLLPLIAIIAVIIAVARK